MTDEQQGPTGGAELADGLADGLGEVLSEVARDLQSHHGDVEATLQAITTAALSIVPGTDECGVSYVIARRRVQPRAWTSELPRLVDALQNDLAEGPCLDAVWREDVVSVDDVRTDPRWPRFATQAGDLGVGSMMCLQLFVEGDQMGALNLYARNARAFTDSSRAVGILLASHAAIALAGAEHEANLATGMNNRDVIGQAKGILMERYKVSADQAFNLLVRTSSVNNRKIIDIAEQLTATGQLPAP